MKIQTHFLLLLVFCFVTGFALRSTAQTGTVKIVYGTPATAPNTVADTRYHVILTPITSGTYYNSMVGINAPLGNLLVTNIQSSATSGNWYMNLHDAPHNNGGGVTGSGGTGGSTSLNYWAFATDVGLTVTAGQPVELFSFTVSGECGGGQFYITDPSIEILINGNRDASSYMSATDFTNGLVGATTDGPVPVCVQAAPAFSCVGATLSPNSFTVGTSGTANATISLQNITAGSYSFTETTAANFATSPATNVQNLTAAATSVTIPVSYDGGGSAGTQNLTFQMSAPGGQTSTCSIQATLTAAAVVGVGNPTPNVTSPTSSTQTGNAATEMNPTGSASGYTYSVVTCTPAPANPLPATSNLTITNASTGAYTYTAPNAAGTYTYCIQACSVAQPLNCATSTYSLTVTSVCNAGSVAPTVIP